MNTPRLLETHGCQGGAHAGCDGTNRTPPLTEVLTLSDEALVAFADFIALNRSKAYTRDAAILRRVFTAYVISDYGPNRGGLVNMSNGELGDE